MSSDSDKVAMAGGEEGGNPLPDLNYVSQLFAQLEGSDSGVVPPAANDSGLAPLDEEHVPMTAEASQPIALPSQCLLRDAVEMKPMLMSQAEQDSVSIDISALERIDAAFMQILLALIKQRQAKGKSEAKWLGQNTVFVEAAQVLGLTQYFKVTAAA